MTKGGQSESGPKSARFRFENNGEPSRARTCDPLIKSQLLYQLSYRPMRKKIIRAHFYVSSEGHRLQSVRDRTSDSKAN